MSASWGLTRALKIISSMVGCSIRLSILERTGWMRSGSYRGHRGHDNLHLLRNFVIGPRGGEIDTGSFTAAREKVWEI